MRLQRKENRLRKAQMRLNQVSKQSKQVQLLFRREQNKRGRYRTRMHWVRGEKSFYGNNRGLLHKAVNLKHRIQGDRPSVSRFLSGAKPRTKVGKLIRKNAQIQHFLVKHTSHAAVNSALAAETAGLKTAEIGQREARNKLKQKYTREAVDDYHRGVFLTGRTAIDAVKGIFHHRKQKKEYRLERAKFRFKKADYAVFLQKTYRPKLADNKEDMEYAVGHLRKRKQRFRHNKLKLKEAKLAYFKSKSELGIDRKKLKTDKAFRKKERKIQRKIAKASRPKLLLAKLAFYTAGRMKASAWQKAVNADADNDFLHAVDSVKRRAAEPAVRKRNSPQRLQRQHKKQSRLSDQKAKSTQKLQKQESRFQKQYSRKKKAISKKSSKKHKRSAGEIIKGFLKSVGNVSEQVVKKFFLVIAFPVLIILLIFAFVLMLFSSASSGGSFTLGTYASQDYDLSEAEKYYTGLADQFNRKLRKIGENWKGGLKALDADTSGMNDAPDTYLFGKSAVFSWEPVYDFDCYQLWAFLCAYYYDFDSADNGDIKYWKFSDSTKKLLDELFSAEYSFVYQYDNQSRFEKRSSYELVGYYSLESCGVTGDCGYIEITHPDALPFSAVDGSKIYFDLNSGAVLDSENEYRETGWYLKNQYITESDSDGNTYDAWYPEGEICDYGIYRDGELITPIPYVIPAEMWCSFLKKQDYKTDCRLYYNVKQNKTFDEVIADKFGDMSHKTERLQYYSLLIGNEAGTGKLYGNHQTLHNILPGTTIRSYTLNRHFGYTLTGWNTDSEGLLEGIRVSCKTGDTVKAPFKCKIQKYDAEKRTVTLRKDDVEYWYDGTGGTKRDTEVLLTNVSLSDGITEGDTVTDCQVFAQTTADSIDIQIYIDTDGIGWDFIDPRLVLY